ncbi:MAG: hypothetical protein WC812_02290 [Candidatus Pacearchaeota archaeon]|jgi:hypothetical protein
MKKTEYQIIPSENSIECKIGIPSRNIERIIKGIMEQERFCELTIPSEDTRYFYDQVNGTMIIIPKQNKERIFIAGPEKERAVSRLNSILENPNPKLIDAPRLVRVVKKEDDYKIYNIEKIIKGTYNPFFHCIEKGTYNKIEKENKKLK